MTETLILLLLVYIVLVVILLFCLMFLPVMTIVHCANSNLSRLKKTFWIIAMLFLWPFASLGYGFTATTPKSLYRKFSIFVVIMFFPLLLPLVSDSSKLLSKFQSSPIAGKILALFPFSPGSGTDSAMHYVLSGIPKMTVENNPNGAIKDFSKAIMLDPSFINAFIHRGKCYLKIGKAEEGKKDFQRALELIEKKIVKAPTNARLYSQRAEVKDLLGDKAGSESDYTEALRLNPNELIAKKTSEKSSSNLNLEAAILVMKGQTSSYKNDNKGALKLFSDAIALDPTLVQAYISRGRLYMKSKNMPLADKDFKTAISLSSAAIASGKEVSTAYSDRGQAKQALGDFKGAEADFKAALKIDSQNLNAKMGLDLLEIELNSKKKQH